MKKQMYLIVVIVLTLVMVIGCTPAAPAGESAAPTGESTAPATTEETQKPEESKVSYDFPMVGETENVKMVEQEPEKPLRFAFLGFQNNPFWNIVQEGVAKATECLVLHNVTVDNINLGEVIDAETINAGLEAAIAQGYDGIVTTPFVTGVENYIDKAVDAGIPVVTLYGESAKPTKRLVFIGQDNVIAGQLAGEVMDEGMGKTGEGKYATITASFTMENLELKRKTADEYLKAKGYTNVGDFEAKDSADKTYTLAKDIITANPDIKAIYCVAGGPYGAAKAVADMGKTGEILVLGHDEIEENLGYVRNGEMVVIGQNPAGVSFDGFMYLYNKVVADQSPEKEVYASYTTLIDKDNVDELFPQK